MPIAAIVALAVGIVAAGVASDRTNPRRVLIAGCIAAVAVGAAPGPKFGSGSLAIVWLHLTLALFVMGFVYGSLGARLPSLFPARVRYTGASLAFDVGGMLGGAWRRCWRRRLDTNSGHAALCHPACIRTA